MACDCYKIGYQDGFNSGSKNRLVNWTELEKLIENLGSCPSVLKRLKDKFEKEGWTLHRKMKCCKCTSDKPENDKIDLG